MKTKMEIGKKMEEKGKEIWKTKDLNDNDGDIIDGEGN